MSQSNFKFNVSLPVVEDVVRLTQMFRFQSPTHPLTVIKRPRELIKLFLGFDWTRGSTGFQITKKCRKFVLQTKLEGPVKKSFFVVY